jgi:iron complex outermembrane receptor protein
LAVFALLARSPGHLPVSQGSSIVNQSSLNRLRAVALASVGVAALTAAAPAFARDDSVEKVVVTAPRYVPTGETTASKSQTPLVEVPQSVTVISRDQIDLLDWSTLGQVVRYTAGVTGENYGPDQRVDWLTVRGFNPVQYIDGLQAAVGSISNVGLDLYGAESVEILKGPSSVLYGATPPGGIVNVTSRRPGQEFGGEIELQGGNYDHKQVNFDITGPLGDKASARFTGLYRDKGGQIDGVDAERVYLAPAFTFQPTDATRITRWARPLRTPTWARRPTIASSATTALSAMTPSTTWAAACRCSRT